MGWIYIGSNRYINVSHIVKISFDEHAGIYEIVLDNGTTIETVILRINLGLSDIIDNSAELPF